MNSDAIRRRQFFILFLFYGYKYILPLMGMIALAGGALYRSLFFVFLGTFTLTTRMFQHIRLDIHDPDTGAITTYSTTE